MSIVHEFNLTESGIVARLGGAALFEEPTNFEIKAVYRRSGGSEWRLCSALIHKMSDCDGRFEQVYQEAAFFSFVRKFESVSEILDELFVEGVVVDEGCPPIKIDESRRWGEVLIPSVSSHTGLPVRHYSYQLGSCSSGDDALIGYQLPYYPSTLERMVDFIAYEQKGSNNIHLLIEDARACIKVDDEQVEVTAEKSVYVSGQLARDGEVEKIDAMSTEVGVLDLSGLASAEIWVLDESNLVLDYLSSSAYPYGYELQIPDLSFEEHIELMIDNGETVGCEFKEYIDLENGGKKKEDIEKTVCALSNTEGGVLVVGVSDHREVLGIDGPVQKTYSSSLETSVHKYVGDVRKRLYETLTVNDCFAVESMELYGKIVIVVSVKKVVGWNFLQATHVPYARKGATSYVATPLVALESESLKRAGHDLF